MSLKANLNKLLATLPAILLMTFINVFICSTTAGAVMILLQSDVEFCQTHHWITLVLSILTAIGVMAWITLNHKLREYINIRSHYE